MNSPRIRFVVSARMLYASLALTGPYEGWGRGLMELKRWMDARGIKASGRPFALFFDNPTETSPAELRSEACFPVSEPFRVEGRFQLKEAPEQTAAETKHEGPPDQYTRTYGAFLESLLKDGYSLDGPAREFFDYASEDLRPGMGVLIQQPLTRVQRTH